MDDVSLEDIVEVIEHHRRRIENIDKRIRDLAEKQNVRVEDDATSIIYLFLIIGIGFILYVVFRFIMVFWAPLLTITVFSIVSSIIGGIAAGIHSEDAGIVLAILIFIGSAILLSSMFFSGVSGDWLFNNPKISGEAWSNLYMYGYITIALSLFFLALSIIYRWKYE